VGQKLSLAGIVVLSEKEWLKEPAKPYLYINANVGKQRGGGYYYCIGLWSEHKWLIFCDPLVFSAGEELGIQLG